MYLSDVQEIQAKVGRDLASIANLMKQMELRGEDMREINKDLQRIIEEG